MNNQTKIKFIIINRIFMDNGSFQRVETQPDEKPARFSIFLNIKSNKSKLMSINRLSDMLDSLPKFKRISIIHFETLCQTIPSCVKQQIYLI